MFLCMRDEKERKTNRRIEIERKREAERKQAFVVSVEPLFPCLKGQIN